MKMTVKEAFEISGHGIPEGARLTAHFLFAGNLTASDVKRYWTWRCVTELGHFLNGQWERDKLNEDDPTDPIRVVSAVSINLCNLPAADCFDELPEAVRTHPDVAARLNQEAQP